MISYKENYTNSKQEFGGYPKSHYVSKCNETHFASFRGKITDEEIDTFAKMPTFCMNYLEDHDGFFENPFSTPNSTFLDIDISFKKYLNESKPDRYDKILQESYFTVYYLNSYVSSIDYHNPVKYYLDSVKQQISISYLKRVFIEVGLSKYSSDNGWILEDKKIIDFFYLSQIRYETVDKSANYPNDICWITFSSPFIIQNYNRQYLKVQDLFAKIGGLINALIILTNLIFMHFLRFEYTKTIFESIQLAKEKKIQSYLIDTNNATDHNHPALRYLNSNKLMTPISSHKNVIKDYNLKDKKSPRQIDNKLKIPHEFNNHIQLRIIKSNNFTGHNHDVDTSKPNPTPGTNQDNYSYFSLISGIICCSKKIKADYDYLYSTVNHVLEVTSYINSVISSDNTLI